MRRIPYIVFVNKKIYYVCPSCKRVIPRDYYIENDYCPHCEGYVNKYAKSIIKDYNMYDKKLYELFINNTRGD